MSEPASISIGIASRYANAAFEIALKDKSLTAVEADVNALTEVLKSNKDLQAMIASPLYSRADQQNAIMAIGAKMKVSPVIKNTLGLMAQKGRLFVLQQFLNALQRLIDLEKGVVTAEVVTAKALTKAQSDELSKVIKAKTGKDVTLNASVDEALIGGLIVKIGSKMIDTSIRSKLNDYRNIMKEVG